MMPKDQPNLSKSDLRAIKHVVMKGVLVRIAVVATTIIAVNLAVELIDKKSNSSTPVTTK